MSARIIFCKNTDELAERAVRLIARSADEAISARGRFNIALSGGSTPEKTYNLLVRGKDSGEVDWSKVYLFFGDERFVPADDSERSNYAMAKRSLLDHSPLRANQIFAFDTTLPTVQASAQAYDDLIAGQLGSPPVFDLILLGMGDDGHTASLFPHAGALEITSRWVVDTPPGLLPPLVDRMTITLPVLNSARHVLFLIGGAKKSEALRDVLEGHAHLRDRPAAGVNPESGDVTYLIDMDAAQLLSNK